MARLMELGPVTKRCKHNTFDRAGQINYSRFCIIYKLTYQIVFESFCLIG